jgi:hypothetical protein
MHPKTHHDSIVGQGRAFWRSLLSPARFALTACHDPPGKDRLRRTDRRPPALAWTGPSPEAWKTLEFARKLERPALHIHPGLPDPARSLAGFVATFNIRTLNIAGSRASKEPGLYEWVQEVLNAAFPDAP